MKTVLVAVCGAALAFAICCVADETEGQQIDDRQTGDQQQAAAEQLDFMMNSVRTLRVVPNAEPSDVWMFHDKPVLRWTNPVGGAPDGIVVLWTDGVRPTVVATVFQNKAGNWVQEFHSLASGPFVVRDGGEVLWEPRKEADEFEPVDDAPAPADSRAKRLAQMRDIARDYMAYDDFTSRGQTTRHELRLLSNPIYRYPAADKQVIDGAVFVFVVGTDPELLLALEARETADASRIWLYRFEAMTYWPVEVKRDGRSVWSVPMAPRDDFRQRIIERD
ncbi:MAG TPA: hypothetical protein VJ783_10645 [Pirellulales bacterium]|nr:hypothetical protein [Pirellulales bacterium]